MVIFMNGIVNRICILSSIVITKVQRRLLSHLLLVRHLAARGCCDSVVCYRGWSVAVGMFLVVVAVVAVFVSAETIQQEHKIIVCYRGRFGKCTFIILTVRDEKIGCVVCYIVFIHMNDVGFLCIVKVT